MREGPLVSSPIDGVVVEDTGVQGVRVSVGADEGCVIVGLRRM